MITMSKEKSGTSILSVMAVKKLLAAGTDIQTVFAEVGAGFRVPVELKDGTAATVWLTESGVEQPDLLAWPLEATRESVPSLLQQYYAHTKAMIELDLTVGVGAVDEDHATRIIDEVLRGEQPAPAGFRVMFEAEETREFMTRFRAAIQTGHVAALGVVHTHVTGFTNPLRRELEYQGDRP